VTVKLKRSLSWFTLVGTLAAMTHYGVAVSLEGFHLFGPAYANIMGFLLAFPVSYVGHAKWTFSGRIKRHTQSIPKFFLVALMGFLGNQGLTLSLLSLTPWPFWMVLAGVMIFIAILTYYLSHFWAFREVS
jgi:putative flippase GtrA